MPQPLRSTAATVPIIIRSFEPTTIIIPSATAITIASIIIIVDIIKYLPRPYHLSLGASFSSSSFFYPMLFASGGPARIDHRGQPRNLLVACRRIMQQANLHLNYSNATIVSFPGIIID